LRLFGVEKYCASWH